MVEDFEKHFKMCDYIENICPENRLPSQTCENCNVPELASRIKEGVKKKWTKMENI